MTSSSSPGSFIYIGNDRVEIILPVRLLFRRDRLGRVVVVVVVVAGVVAGLLLFPPARSSAVSSRVLLELASVETTVPEAMAAAVPQFPSFSRHFPLFQERTPSMTSTTETMIIGT